MKVARVLFRYSRVFTVVFVFALLAVFAGSRRVDAAGLWTEQTGSPTGNWKSVRMSSDGSKIIASVVETGTTTNSVLYSSDGGVSWNDITPPTGGTSDWSAVTISQDGYDVVAVDRNDGYIWYSPNDGNYWIQETDAGAGYWSAVTIAQNGFNIAATDPGNNAIWDTSDGGGTWNNVAPSANPWQSIAYSENGLYLVTSYIGGQICHSLNFAETFTCGYGAAADWTSFSAGDEGNAVAAGGYSSPVYYGAGYSSSWANIEQDGNHLNAVGMSEDGTVMAEAQLGGYIYTANTSTPTVWTEQDAAGNWNWNDIAINGDGTKMAAGNDTGHVWTFDANGTPPDTTPPVITILGDNPVTVPAYSTYTDAGATAEDNVDGDVTSSIQTSGSVNTNVPGTYTITYVVSDVASNTSTSTRSVIVSQPVTPPHSSGGSGGSGGSVVSQVHSLQLQGNNKVAQTLIQEFPNLFTPATPGTSAAVGATGSATGASRIKVGLSYHSNNNSVKILQQLLGADPSLNYTGGVTGYYGKSTQAAVEAFQVAHSVVKPGHAGYGSVGPKTRLALIAAYGA